LLRLNSKGEKEVISIKQIEWRFVLNRSELAHTIELFGMKA